MKRRDFFYKAGIASLAMLAQSRASAQSTVFSGKIETASDLNNYLRSIYQNADVPFDADEIIVGEPKTKIKKVATMWLPNFSDIKKAQKFITELYRNCLSLKTRIICLRAPTN